MVRNPVQVEVGDPSRSTGLSRFGRMLWPAVHMYAKTELPRYGYVLHWWGMNEQSLWNSAATVVDRERFHKYKVRYDLSDFFQRIDYFFGCYHELDILGTLDVCLRPGEAFVDAGANIGLVTLHAAGRVGPKGMVYAFEPNPAVHDVLAWHVAENGLSWVKVFRAGVSDVSETVALRLPGADNQAAATFGPIPERYGGHVADLGTVDVMRGDDVIPLDDPRPLVVKMDVEGFELRALQGMEKLIERRRPAIVTEVNGEMLWANGASAEAIFDFLAKFNYKLFGLDRGGFRQGHRIKLHPLKREHIQWEKDVLFVSPDGPHWPRIEGAIQPQGKYWRHIKMQRGR